MGKEEKKQGFLNCECCPNHKKCDDENWWQEDCYEATIKYLQKKNDKLRTVEENDKVEKRYNPYTHIQFNPGKVTSKLSKSDRFYIAIGKAVTWVLLALAMIAVFFCAPIMIMLGTGAVSRWMLFSDPIFFNTFGSIAFVVILGLLIIGIVAKMTNNDKKKENEKN